MRVELWQRPAAQKRIPARLARVLMGKRRPIRVLCPQLATVGREGKAAVDVDGEPGWQRQREEAKRAATQRQLLLLLLLLLLLPCAWLGRYPASFQGQSHGCPRRWLVQGCAQVCRLDL